MGIEEAPSPSRASLRERLSHVSGELFFIGVLALGCLAFLGGSIPLHFGVAQTGAKVQEELATLPFAPGQPAGTRAVLTGTIAADTKPLLKDFVVYVEELYHGPSKHRVDEWEFEGGKRQSFRIDTSSGSMDLASPEYDLSPRTPETAKPLLPDWDHVEKRFVGEPGILEGSRRIRGLVAGGPVTAVGTVTPDGTFAAEYVVGSDLEGMQKALEPIASGETSTLAYWMTAIGLIGLALTVGLFVRTILRAISARSSD